MAGVARAHKLMSDRLNLKHVMESGMDIARHILYLALWILARTWQFP